MYMRQLSLASVSLFALGTCPVEALAGDIKATTETASVPSAVSGVNGSLTAYAGNTNAIGSFGGIGSMTLPVTTSLGVQIDAVLGSSHADIYPGAAGHVFLRDSSRGAIGIAASYLSWSRLSTNPASDLPGGVVDTRGATVGKVGLEGELYLNRFTLKAAPAYQFGTRTGAAGKASINYYPTDRARLDVSGSYIHGVGRYVSAGAEWAPAMRLPLNLFVRAGLDWMDRARVLGGVQIFFGKSDKSLIRRQREDNLDVELPNNLFEFIGNSHCPVGAHMTNGYCDGNG